MPVFSDGQKISETEWARLIQSVPASYVVWKDGSTYRAECLLKGGTDYSGTDAATVIQSALDNGKKVFIKNGEYGISTDISLRSGTVLVGEGYDTVLKATVADVGVKAVNVDNVVVENLRIDGSYDTLGGSGINLEAQNSGKVIFRNVWTHNSGADGAGFWHGSRDCWIVNCWAWDTNTNGFFIEKGGVGESYHCGVINSISYNAGGDGIRFTEAYECILKANILVNPTRSGILADYAHRSVVEGNIIINPTQSGISIGNSEDTIVKGNLINTTGAGYSGIASGASDSRIQIIGNKILSSGGMGISAESSNIAITGNTIKGSAWNGIHIASLSSATVQGNVVIENGQRGIYLKKVQKSTVTGNVVKNNSQNTAGANDGIALEGTATTSTQYNLISGNIVFDDQTTKTQRWNIIEVAYCDYNRIEDNMVEGYHTGAISKTGTHTIVKGNVGYVTENSGTATISSSTYVDVTHGLAGTPTVINVTPATSGTGDWYLSNIGDTTFRINVANSGTYTFHWTAEYKP